MQNRVPFPAALWLAIALLPYGCDGTSSVEAPVDAVAVAVDVARGDVPFDVPFDVLLDVAVERDIGGADVEEPNPLLPPRPLDTLGYERPVRAASGTPPTSEEVSAFTERLSLFFVDTGYFDWVWRVSNGLDESYDPDMMGYKLWWKHMSMRKEGDTVVFADHGRAENIAERTMKVIPNVIAGYLLTGNQRMADIATAYMKGMVALSLGCESAREDPVVKYLQARAIFNHNHSYRVDGRPIEIDYSSSCVPSAKWNVHIFELPDNPMYGGIWVSNMRSKDDVPYVYQSMTMATRAYYEAADPALREAALLYIEYLRGFCQSIIDNDWYILTRYEDGLAARMYNIDAEGSPPADLGSFVHWELLFGEDAECNAQLGAALTATGTPLSKGDCGRGLAGMPFESMALATHFFNYEIYAHFHIGALASAHLWRKPEVARPLMEGLVERFDSWLHDETLPNRDDPDFNAWLAAWLLAAATHGYPLTADEAHHIMEWYGRSADWYRQWPHWDPWNSMQDGDFVASHRPPSEESVADTEGNEQQIGYLRLMEMPYVYEYCASPLRDKDGVQFVDCEAIGNLALVVED